MTAAPQRPAVPQQAPEQRQPQQQAAPQRAQPGRVQQMPSQRMPQRRPVPSPCVSICRIDPDSGLCEGCLRTLEEIAEWGRMTDERKLQVRDALAQRRAARGAG
jgi:predicted Fe-S protein YdhL (DUF1289 family)